MIELGILVAISGLVALSVAIYLVKKGNAHKTTSK